MSCNFMSCSFMPCNLVLRFHVRHFQRPQLDNCEAETARNRLLTRTGRLKTREWKMQELTSRMES